MNERINTVRITVVCDFCGTKNELTILDPQDHQPVTCSTCGGKLGTVGELRAHDPEAPEIADSERRPPRTS